LSALHLNILSIVHFFLSNIFFIQFKSCWTNQIECTRVEIESSGFFWRELVFSGHFNRSRNQFALRISWYFFFASGTAEMRARVFVLEGCYCQPVRDSIKHVKNAKFGTCLRLISTFVWGFSTFAHGQTQSNSHYSSK
jgi:hypothetical protein